MLLSLSTVILVLTTGVVVGKFAGLYVGIAAHALGNLVRVIWLRARCRRDFAELRERDRTPVTAEAPARAG